jgi:hypothetical protein
VRKAQKFGYRNKELISPEKGLRSSDSFFVSSLPKMHSRVSTHLELAKRKGRGKEANFDHEARVVTNLGQVAHALSGLWPILAF